MPRLGVNVDHVATLRQARGVDYPDPVEAALLAEEAGADGITVHLREDRRHIQERDVEVLRARLRIPLNLEMAVTDAMARGTPPVRDFMLKQTREDDLRLFVELSKVPAPATAVELPMRVVIPAYVISELKTGFQMGFFLFVPFLLIDLVVSTTLLSMGMMQLPPAMVSLPFKVLLFVMIDGWNLVVGSIVRSFA